MIIDTHCHLDSLQNNPSELSSEFSRFTQIHLTPKFLAMATHSNQWVDLLGLSNRYPSIYCALGIHPWYARAFKSDDLHHLEFLLETQSITALGEIGLDFRHEYMCHKNVQLELLHQQLELARRYSKPTSIHVVKAHVEMFTALSEYSSQGVIHGLGSSLQIAQRYVDLGFKIGVNGVSVRSNARRYHDLIKHFGLDHLVLETDFPNVKLPGLVESQLIDIVAVAEQFARLLRVSVDTVLQATAENAQAVFKF